MIFTLDREPVFAVLLRNGQVTVRPKNSPHLKDGNLPVLSRLVHVRTILGHSIVVWRGRYPLPNLAGDLSIVIWPPGGSPMNDCRIARDLFTRLRTIDA